MGNFVVDFGVVLAIVIGLVEVAKRLSLPEKFAPVFSIVAGIGLTAWQQASFGFPQVVLGLVIGLSAVGLFSSAKNVSEGVSDLFK